MTTLTKATNHVVQEFLSRTIDNFAQALLDGQHFEHRRNKWVLFDRFHKRVDEDPRLSTLLQRNYSYNELRAVK